MQGDVYTVYMYNNNLYMYVNILFVSCVPTQLGTQVLLLIKLFYVL